MPPDLSDDLDGLPGTSRHVNKQLASRALSIPEHNDVLGVPQDLVHVLDRRPLPVLLEVGRDGFCRKSLSTRFRQRALVYPNRVTSANNRGSLRYSSNVIPHFVQMMKATGTDYCYSHSAFIISHAKEM
jgi:hypothetical protein